MTRAIEWDRRVSPSVAEFLAVQLAVEGTAEGKVHIVTDCAKVAADYVVEPAVRDDYRNEDAGWWRIIDTNKFHGVTKVKGHGQPKGDAMREGNAVADAEAKMAARTSWPYMEDVSAFAVEQGTAGKDLVELGKFLATIAWPTWTKDQRPKGRRWLAVVDGKRVKGPGHTYVWEQQGGKWLCVVCGRRGRKQRRAQRCPGAKAMVGGIHVSHKVSAARDEAGAIHYVCTRCTAASVSRLANLGKACEPSKGYPARIRRIQRSKDPNSGVNLRSWWPVMTGPAG